jgi:hypothetical protein
MYGVCLYAFSFIRILRGWVPVRCRLRRSCLVKLVFRYRTNRVDIVYPILDPVGRRVQLPFYDISTWSIEAPWHLFQRRSVSLAYLLRVLAVNGNGLDISKHRSGCPLPLRDCECQGMPPWLLAHLHDPKLLLLRKYARILLELWPVPSDHVSAGFLSNCDFAAGNHGNDCRDGPWS